MLCASEFFCCEMWIGMFAAFIFLSTHERPDADSPGGLSGAVSI